MNARSWLAQHAVDLFDLSLALFFAATAQYEIWAHPLVDDGIPGPRLLNSALLLLVTLPLALRRVAPTAVFALVLCAIGLQVGLVDHAHSQQPPFEEWIALLVIFYSLGAHAERRRAIAAALVGGGVFVVADVISLARGTAAAGDTVPAWFLLATALGLGVALRGQRLEAAFLTRHTERLEREEKSRLAAAEERARIARELHDVVAHAISVIVVQAQAAQRVLEGEQASAREALGSIEATGRQALGEMRRALGVIRAGENEAALAPQPSLQSLGLLLEQAREGGLEVELEIEGEPRALSPGVDLSAYRIVQEALTNTRKHAGPARARVVIRYLPEELELEVTDDGCGPLRRAGGGQGLIGMRERAALLGGVLEAGSRNGRGFAVRVRLPG